MQNVLLIIYIYICFMLWKLLSYNKQWLCFSGCICSTAHARCFCCRGLNQSLHVYTYHICTNAYDKHPYWQAIDETVCLSLHLRLYCACMINIEISCTDPYIDLRVHVGKSHHFVFSYRLRHDQISCKVIYINTCREIRTHHLNLDSCTLCPYRWSGQCLPVD